MSESTIEAPAELAEAAGSVLDRRYRAAWRLLSVIALLLVGAVALVRGATSALEEAQKPIEKRLDDHEARLRHIETTTTETHEDVRLLLLKGRGDSP